MPKQDGQLPMAVKVLATLLTSIIMLLLVMIIIGFLVKVLIATWT